MIYVCFKFASSTHVCVSVHARVSVCWKTISQFVLLADMLLIDSRCIKAAIETKYPDQLSLTAFASHTAF